MSVFTIAWLIWLGAFLVIEGWALLNKTRGDTLSEHVWEWFNIRSHQGWHWLRWLLAIFMIWLSVHMIAGF